MRWKKGQGNSISEAKLESKSIYVSDIIHVSWCIYTFFFCLQCGNAKIVKHVKMVPDFVKFISNCIYNVHYYHLNYLYCRP